MSTPPPALPEWLSTTATIAPALALGVGAIALLASLAALGVSISSRRLAGKSYRLAEQKEDRQVPLVDLDIEEAKQDIKANGDRLIEIRAVITNRSEVSTSIRGATLWVVYSKRGRDYRSEVAPSRASTNQSLALLSLVNGRASARFDLRFEIPHSRIVDWVINSYDLVLKDTDNRSITYVGVSLKRDTIET